MASADPLQALEVPGRVYRGVTGFSAAPYGGTELGLLLDVRWELVDVFLRHRAEEFGAAVVGGLYAGEAFSLAFAIRSLDDDALVSAWPNSRVGAVSGHRVFYGPGAVRPGALVESSSRTTSLLFVPDDAQNHDAVILPRAVPRRDPIQTAPLRVGSELVTGMTWLALPGANGLAYEIGRLPDLTALS